MTEELYDLTTMAMEYFKEHLEPCLPSLMPIPVMSRSRFVDYSKSECRSNAIWNKRWRFDARMNYGIGFEVAAF